MYSFPWRNWFFSVLIAAFLFPCFAEISRADVLAQYLFWNSMGNTVGKGMQAHADYRAERQLWKDKIAAAKAEMKRCGNCASAKAELHKWQRIENQFQDAAGSMAQAAGMDPKVAQWLGIDMPLTRGTTKQELEARRVVRPTWIDDRPDFCKKASNAHINCLKNYQGKYGLWHDLKGATSPGGACYESNKLYNYCYWKDYKSFDREKTLQAARATGKIIPEYINDDDLYPQVYYGRVRDDFMPHFPPADVIRTKLSEEDGVRNISYIMFKKGKGFLGVFTVSPFLRVLAVPESKCFSVGFKPTKIERRECDDLYEMQTRSSDLSPILTCLYTRQGGTTEENHDYTEYWYDERPNLADPARLLARSHSHPLLKIGDPRTDCLATKREVDKVKAAYLAKISKLRAQTPETPTSVVMSKSKWQQKQDKKQEERKLLQDTQDKRALAAFPIEGRYTLGTYRNQKRLRDMRCTINKIHENRFELTCKFPRRRGQSQVNGTVEGNKFIVHWKDITIAFKVSGARQLSGLNENKTIQQILSRTGDLVKSMSNAAKVAIPQVQKTKLQPQVRRSKRAEPTSQPDSSVSGKVSTESGISKATRPDKQIYTAILDQPNFGSYPAIVTHVGDQWYVDYPSLHCGSVMKPEGSTDGSAFSFVETLTYGQRYCVNGRRTFKRNKNGFYTQWFYGNQLPSTGTLTLVENASNNLVGFSEWRGSYVCSRRKIGLSLIMSRSVSGAVEAEFFFYPKSGKNANPWGKYRLTGNVSEGVLQLNPVAWIIRPAGYKMVAMNGIINLKRHIFNGKIQASGCSTFSLKRYH